MHLIRRNLPEHPFPGFLLRCGFQRRRPSFWRKVVQPAYGLCPEMVRKSPNVLLHRPESPFDPETPSIRPYDVQRREGRVRTGKDVAYPPVFHEDEPEPLVKPGPPQNVCMVVADMLRFPLKQRIRFLELAGSRFEQAGKDDPLLFLPLPPPALDKIMPERHPSGNILLCLDDQLAVPPERLPLILPVQLLQGWHGEEVPDGDKEALAAEVFRALAPVTYDPDDVGCRGIRIRAIPPGRFLQPVVDAEGQGQGGRAGSVPDENTDAVLPWTASRRPQGEPGIH